MVSGSLHCGFPLLFILKLDLEVMDFCNRRDIFRIEGAINAPDYSKKEVNQ
jgi:hypothetical protein